MKQTRNWMAIVNASGSEDPDKDAGAKKYLKKYMNALERKIDADTDNIRGAVFQLEKSEDKVFHVQGFFQFSHQKSLSAAKKYLQLSDNQRFVRLTPINNIERSIMYCCKKGEWTNAEGQKHFSETFGEAIKIRLDQIIAKGSKIATNKDAAKYVMDALTKKQDFLEFAKENPESASRHRCFFNQLYFEESYLERSSLGYIKIEARIHYGDSNTGKTKRVFDEFGYDNVFSLELDKQGTWFNGYKKQKVLLIDEYSSKLLPRYKLLKYLDGYPLKLPIKGGFVMAFWHVVILTTNKNVIYELERDPALARRFDTVDSFSANREDRKKTDFQFKTRNFVTDAEGTLKEISNRIPPPFLDCYNA
jgi:hypothetical protein